MTLWMHLPTSDSHMKYQSGYITKWSAMRVCSRKQVMPVHVKFENYYGHYF